MPDNSPEYKDFIFVAESISDKLLLDIKSKEITSATTKMNQLIEVIKAYPEILNETAKPQKLGQAFVAMLGNGILSEGTASIAYALISKAINQSPYTNPNLYINRLLTLDKARDLFKYTMQLALDVNNGGQINFFSPLGQMAPTRARDGIFKMEIADLYPNPVIYQQVNFFRVKKEEFDSKIAANFFYNQTVEDLIKEGRANHEKAYKYFHNKIFVNHNIEI
jgi:hypothetical protein